MIFLLKYLCKEIISFFLFYQKFLHLVSVFEQFLKHFFESSDFLLDLCYQLYSRNRHFFFFFFFHLVYFLQAVFFTLGAFLSGRLVTPDRSGTSPIG